MESLNCVQFSCQSRIQASSMRTLIFSIFFTNSQPCSHVCSPRVFPLIPEASKTTTSPACSTQAGSCSQAKSHKHTRLIQFGSCFSRTDFPPVFHLLLVTLHCFQIFEFFSFSGFLQLLRFQGQLNQTIAPLIGNIIALIF